MSIFCLCTEFNNRKTTNFAASKNFWKGQDEGRTNLKFDLGKKEFLAIALEKPFNLPWLNPREYEELIEWNCERIKELFEELEKQNNWQVFHQSFDVVESEKKLLSFSKSDIFIQTINASPKVNAC